MKRYWPIPVAIFILLVFIDGILGILAYNTATWNYNHTAVITGWENVKQICFQLFPIAMGFAAILITIIILLTNWAYNAVHSK